MAPAFYFSLVIRFNSAHPVPSLNTNQHRKFPISLYLHSNRQQLSTATSTSGYSSIHSQQWSPLLLSSPAPPLSSLKPWVPRSPILPPRPSRPRPWKLCLVEVDSLLRTLPAAPATTPGRLSPTTYVSHQALNSGGASPLTPMSNQQPVVQYWYMVVPDSGVKADRMWNHLNLNGCAPTENKYYSEPGINGIALTFHTSEACTAARVSDAYRSSSDPPYNVACQFTDKDGVDPGEAAASAGDDALDGILEAIGAFGGGE